MLRLLSLLLLAAPASAQTSPDRPPEPAPPDSVPTLAVDVPRLLVRGLSLQIDTLDAEVNVDLNARDLARLDVDLDAALGRVDVQIGHLSADADVQVYLDSLLASIVPNGSGAPASVVRDLARPGGVVSRQPDGDGYRVRTLAPDGTLRESRFDAAGRIRSTQTVGSVREADVTRERPVGGGRVERRAQDGSAVYEYESDADGQRIEGARVVRSSGE